MSVNNQETSGLKIRERKITVKGHVYQVYEVDFGTNNGRRRRRTFKTRAKAERAIRDWQQQQELDGEKQKILGKRIGEFATKLTNDDLLDAARGLDILTRTVTLTDAAAFYMRHNNPTGGKKTVAEAGVEFVTSRIEKGCRAATIKGYRDKLDYFCRDLGKKPISHITVAVLEDWLRSKRFTPATRRSNMRHLGTLFAWALKRRYMTENPIALMDMPRLDKKPVTYLTPDEVESLLRTAASDYPELVPYVALSVFAGLRPVELHGEKTDHGPLDWRNIDLVRGKVTVTPAQDKNREGRRVDVSQALLAWLFPVQRPEGPIHFGRTMFESLIRRSGVNYRKDIMRHTFGTYYQAMHRNEGETAIQMGDTIRTVKRHYINPLVDKEDAERFWSIRPATETNVIPFVKSATA